MFVTEMTLSDRQSILKDRLRRLSRIEDTPGYNRFLSDVRQQFPKGMFNERMAANLRRAGGTLALTRTLNDLFIGPKPVRRRIRGK